jgi:hypothetical protein
MRPTRSDRPSAAMRGFTLIEVIVAATILFVIVLLVMRTLRDANNLLSTTSVKADGEVKADVLLGKITERFRNGVISTLTKGSSPTTFNSGESEAVEVRCRLMDGYSGSVVPGKTVSVCIVKDEDIDGVDNDGDGLVDEYNLRIREWPDDDTLATPTVDQTINFNLQSISFTRVNRNLQVQVSVQRLDPANQQTRTMTARSTITLRN